MTEPYLILHKVRGEPAFDVASRIRCGICGGVGGHNVPDFETGIVSDYEGFSCDECNGEGFWWIIPTSGHRAYPYWEQKLDDLSIDLSYPGEPEFKQMGEMIVPMPKGWPDHYSTRSDPKPTFSITSLISNLVPKLRR